MKRLSVLGFVAMAASLVAFFGFAATARSDVPSCGLGSYNSILDTCDISGAVTASGTYNFNRSVRMLNGSDVNASVATPSPPGITLNINGDPNLNFTMMSTSSLLSTNDTGASGNSAGPITINVNGNMDMQDGSAITSENTVDGGDSGDVAITVGGNMSMEGSATINSSNPSATSGTVGAGNITITVGNFPNVPPVGDFSMASGTSILADADHHPAGAITITSGKSMEIDGTVESKSGESGQSPHQPPGGGTITLKTGCKLTESPTGVISSQGQDPGADLVHLEGCDVFINGIVRSIGVGHGEPDSPPNHCNNDTVAHPPGDASFYTACVEIWANNITIDSTNGNNGEVYADNIQAPGRAWIDLFANNNVNIIGDTSGPYAVHAVPDGTSNTLGGLITIKAKTGTVTASNEAVTTAPVGNGGTGGTIDVEAAGKVDLDTATLNAAGDYFGASPPCPSGSGTCGNGGHIVVSAWGSGSNLTWQNGDGDVRPNLSGPNGAGGTTTAGDIKLNACGGTITTTGTNFNGATPTTTTNCDSSKPTLPSNVQTAFSTDSAIWAACNQQPSFSISGTKHLNTLTGAGLQGWTINLYDEPGNTLDAQSPQVTDPSGNYSFNNLPAGTYKVCEVLQAGWTQTAPTSGPSCTGSGEAPIGITVTIGPSSTGDDFANQQTLACQKQPVQDVLNPTTGRYPGNKGPDMFVILSQGGNIQNAIDNVTDVNNDGYLIIQVLKDTTGQLGGSTSQRFTISQNYAKPFALIGCSITLNDPDATKPTEWIQSTAGSPGNIFVMDLHGSGSNVAGIEVDGSGREIRNAYADNNPGVGYLVTGNGNTLHNGEAVGNGGDGYYVTSNSNLITDANAFSNKGNGFDVVGNSNTLNNLDAGDKGKGNSGDGIHVVGNSNTISGGDAFANTGDGMDVSGNSNTFTNDASGDRSGKGNGGDGYRVSGSSNNLNGNKAASNGGNGFDISGGSSGANLLKNDSSNTGASGSDLENTLAEYLLTGTVKNNGGGNKADSITIPKTSSPTKCTSFPATNATVTFVSANTCE